MTDNTAINNVDARLQGGETINYYTYEGQKSDLQKVEGNVTSWKSGVSFDNPDEGKEIDRFARPEDEPREETAYVPTDKTLAASNFASVMSQWPSDEKTLGYIAETILENEPYTHFGNTFEVVGEQIVMTDNDGDMIRTNAAEFLAVVEAKHPAVFERAVSEVESRKPEAKPEGIDLVAATDRFAARQAERQPTTSQTEALSR